MKDTSKVALDSIQSMLDFIRSNERQSQSQESKYMVIFLAFDSIIIDKKRFNTREEAKAYAMRTPCLTSIVCQEGDYHEEEKIQNPYF